VSVSTNQIVRTVKAHKAQPVVSAVPSVVIVIDGAMPIAREEKRNRMRQEQDARRLAEALAESLPVGTLEKLCDFIVDNLGRAGLKSARHTISRGKVKATGQE